MAPTFGATRAKVCTVQQANLNDLLIERWSNDVSNTRLQITS